MSVDLDAALRRYADFFATLQPGFEAALRALVTEDVRFRDPFNDVRGVDRMERIFAHMFAALDDPRFEIGACARSGHTGFVRWTMTFGLSGGMARGSWSIEGVSEVLLAEDGRVTTHIDHWDAAGQLYERLPLIGPVLRLVRRKLAS